MDKKSIGSGKPMLLTHLSIKQTLLFLMYLLITSGYVSFN